MDICETLNSAIKNSSGCVRSRSPPTLSPTSFFLSHFFIALFLSALSRLCRPVSICSTPFRPYIVFVAISVSTSIRVPYDILTVLAGIPVSLCDLSRPCSRVQLHSPVPASLSSCTHVTIAGSCPSFSSCTFFRNKDSPHPRQVSLHRHQNVPPHARDGRVRRAAEVPTRIVVSSKRLVVVIFSQSSCGGSDGREPV